MCRSDSSRLLVFPHVRGAQFGLLVVVYGHVLFVEYRKTIEYVYMDVLVPVSREEVWEKIRESLLLQFQEKLCPKLYTIMICSYIGHTTWVTDVRGRIPLEFRLY